MVRQLLETVCVTSLMDLQLGVDWRIPISRNLKICVKTNFETCAVPPGVASGDRPCWRRCASSAALSWWYRHWCRLRKAPPAAGPTAPPLGESTGRPLNGDSHLVQGIASGPLSMCPPARAPTPPHACPRPREGVVRTGAWRAAYHWLQALLTW